MGNLSQRDPAGSPLTKTGGIPLGIPYGPHMSSQMGPVRVPKWCVSLGGCGVVEGMLQSYYPKTGYYPVTRSNTRRVPGCKNTRKSEH